MPPLKDDHQYAICRADRENVHQHSLERQQQRTEHEQQQQEGGNQNEGDCLGEVAIEIAVEIQADGLKSTDQHRHSLRLRGASTANVVNQRFSSVAIQLRIGGCRYQRRITGGIGGDKLRQRRMLLVGAAGVERNQL